MTVDISLEINGERVAGVIEPRLLLADFIRDDLGLTGTHLGCEHGVCGACTIQMDGAAVRSCLMFAVQADGHRLDTVEGMAISPDELNPLQQAFHEFHALQCGFCTPGILMTMSAFLRNEPDPTAEQVKTALSGNLCRCTGYQNIVTAVLEAAKRMRADAASPRPSTIGGGGHDGD
jgi:aerobic-type carbon monoxide dehydrogenase small subunit (CoxS/CutS family)